MTNEASMRAYGRKLATHLGGGECIELVGDVGAGKTTFVKGLAAGLLIDEDIQSPSFTISREYGARDGLRLAHYDFYRLGDGGIMEYELAESLLDARTITVVEWGETIGAVLPEDRIRLTISSLPDSDARYVTLEWMNQA